MRILVVNGHPLADSFNGQWAKAYARGAQAAGHQVHVCHVGQLQFDPILRHGYTQIQPLEADLLAFQEQVRQAEHIVWVYPTWWGGLPALLKGLIDRTFLPGFAFKYHTDDPFWDKLLQGRSSSIVTTMDSPQWWYELVYMGAGQRQFRWAILWFSGFKVRRTAKLADVKKWTTQRAAAELAKAEARGHAAW